MSDRGTVTTVRGTRVPSGYGVVVMGTNDVTTLRFQEMGKSELPPPPRYRLCQTHQGSP
jgi:hypothetical protein